MEKTDLDITVAETDKWQDILEQSFSALHEASAESRQHCIGQISLYGCLALKYASEDYAEQCFQQLMKIAEDAAADLILLTAIRDMLATAARLRKKELFCNWLNQSEEFIKKVINARENPDELSRFLLSITFIICDRKHNDAFNCMRHLMVLFVRTSVNKAVLKSFVSEWTSLIAQMLRRQWFEVGDFLLLSLFEALWRKKDCKLLNAVLLQLHLHLQMYCRWDGAENAFKAYKKLQYFYFVLVNYAGRSSNKEEERKEYLRAVLLNVRDLIANMARIAMQDELKIIRQWYDCLVFEAGDRMQQRAKLLLQLEISYWSRTKPKTSRKQLAYLKDLLQPDLLSKNYHELLLIIS